MTLPKIIYIPDEVGWGGWTRGLAYQKYLSNEFQIDMEIIRNLTPIDVRKYDVIWLAFHTMLQYPWIREEIKRKKSIVTVTSNEIIKKHWTPKAFKQWCKNVNIMLINNLRIENEIKRYFNGPVMYCPRGTDAELFRPIKVDYINSFKLLYVGKPTKEKGLHSVILPLSKACDVPVVMNTRNFQTMLPYEQMVHHYNNGHVYIVASVSDGTPNPALEAAACGRPIISNHIGNMPEFIKDGYNGFLVNLELNEYIEKVDWMLSHRKEAQVMGENARKTVLKSWTWEKVTENERKALRKLLSM